MVYSNTATNPMYGTVHSHVFEVRSPWIRKHLIFSATVLLNKYWSKLRQGPFKILYIVNNYTPSYSVRLLLGAGGSELVLYLYCTYHCHCTCPETCECAVESKVSSAPYTTSFEMVVIRNEDDPRAQQGHFILSLLPFASVSAAFERNAESTNTLAQMHTVWRHWIL